MRELTKARIALDAGLGMEVRRQRLAIGLPGGDVQADVYRPATGAGPETLLPAVLFIHGDASTQDLADVLDWGQYRSWGEAVAALGLCAVVLQHRSSDGLRHAPKLLAELQAAIASLRDGAVPGIDASRIGVWTCSAGSSFGVTAALAADPPVAFIVSYYGFLDVRHLAARLDPGISTADLAAVSPAAVVLRMPRVPPTLIVRAALDRPELNESIDRFVAAAHDRGDVRVEEHASGQHGLDVLDRDERTRELIALTLHFMEARLT
jgi:acetyl esterase/lipase